MPDRRRGSRAIRGLRAPIRFSDGRAIGPGGGFRFMGCEHQGLGGRRPAPMQAENVVPGHAFGAEQDGKAEAGKREQHSQAGPDHGALFVQ